MDSKEEFLKGIRYFEEDGKTVAERDIPICDFCMGDPEERPITWSYPADEFPLDPNHPVADISMGEWGACDGCHELIEIEDFGALFERSFEQQITRFTEYDPEKISRVGKALMKAATLRTWHRFQEARTGPAIPEKD